MYCIIIIIISSSSSSANSLHLCFQPVCLAAAWAADRCLLADCRFFARCLETATASQRNSDQAATDTHTDRQTDIQTDKHTDIQRERQSHFSSYHVLLLLTIFLTMSFIWWGFVFHLLFLKHQHSEPYSSTGATKVSYSFTLVLSEMLQLLHTENNNIHSKRTHMLLNHTSVKLHNCPVGRGWPNHSNEGRPYQSFQNIQRVKVRKFTLLQNKTQRSLIKALQIQSWTVVEEEHFLQ